jgi:hypothetical protein
MSGKQDKRLRRAALGLAATVAGAGREIKERELLVKNFKSDKGHAEALYVQQVTNSPTSLRGITRTLKKGSKLGKIH